MNAQQLDAIEAKARAALDQTRGQWWVEFYNGKAYLKDQMGQLAGFTIMSQDAAHLAAACYPAAVLDLVAAARRGLTAYSVREDLERMAEIFRAKHRNAYDAPIERSIFADMVERLERLIRRAEWNGGQPPSQEPQS